MPRRREFLSAVADPETPPPGWLPYTEASRIRWLRSCQRIAAAKAKEDSKLRKAMARAKPRPASELHKGFFKPTTARAFLRRIEHAESCLKGKRDFTWDDLEFLKKVCCCEVYRGNADDKPLAPEPTTERPGTEAYAEVIAQRMEMGYQAFHPDDYSLDDLPDDVGLMAGQAKNGAKLPAYVDGERAGDAVEVGLRGEDALLSREETLTKAGLLKRKEEEKDGDEPRKPVEDWYDPGSHERVYEEKGANGEVIKVTREPGRAARYAK